MRYAGVVTFNGVPGVPFTASRFYFFSSTKHLKATEDLV